MTAEMRPFEILLAEDNLADVGLVRRALKSHEVECLLHVIPDGAEVIQWIDRIDGDASRPFLDLILLDMHLPKRDGEDILKRLRSTEHYGQTPVIVMTSADSSMIEESATRHAALFYFKKPSSLDEFMELGSIVRSILVSERPQELNGEPDQKLAGGTA